MKRLVIAIVCLFAVSINCSIASPITQFGIVRQRSVEGYQQYVGKKVVFYIPINRTTSGLKGKINYGAEYTIERVEGLSVVDNAGDSNIKLIFSFKEVGNVKSKPIKIVCYDGMFLKGIYSELEASDIPLYFVDIMKEATDKYIGKTLSYNNAQIKITGIQFMADYVPYSKGNLNYPCFIYEDLATGEKTKESFKDAFGGSYFSVLSKVEKPADESVRYGETSTIEDKGITKFSYTDNIIDITIFGTKEEFSFSLKNNSENSIKVVWNEAVFVGLDGSTSKIMHAGTKFSQKEADQPASVIIRGAKIDDVAVPTSNVRYSSILKDWVTDSMYPNKEGKDGQVRLMLPIQIKETINEYVFVFDIKFAQNHPELMEL
ncbi:MAG: hypothetical protein IKW86_08745 [Salinivirgaceae bacterium]|nr:hypothetical protein [Salinivirgaceae bacterium]